MNPYVPHPYKILNCHRESPDTFTLKVNMKTDHDPGQFVQVSIPGIGECPISICSDSRTYIKLNIREVGNVTKALSRLRKGDTILIRGPYGKGYPMKLLKGNNLLIIGAGCGVAPLKGIIEYVENNRDDYRGVWLFFGYHSDDDVLFKKEMEAWEKKHNLHVALSHQAKPGLCYDVETGHITDALREYETTNEEKVVFLCGPPRFIKDAIMILKNKGFHDDQMFISAERLMYCALGVCCHCMIRGKFTCVDGPVFRYDEIKDLTND